MVEEITVDDQHKLSQQLETIRDYMRWSVSRFNQAGLYFGHGTDNAWDEARLIIWHCLKLPHSIGAEVLDAKLTDKERKLILVTVETRIIERIPAAYLLGEAWFAGLPFKVDERVLIPRSPIAELIEHQFQPWLGSTQPQRILDLCTGSGCIGIACAYAFPDAEVDLVDISAEALEVARQNIEKHHLQGVVHALQSDLFAELERSQQYQLIVSNPPYVDAQDLSSMPAEYQHEPVLALEADADGLRFARQILSNAADYLSDDGLLVVEVGNSGEHLEAQFPDVPFTWVEFERGGDGVFVMTRQELLQYQGRFA